MERPALHADVGAAVVLVQLPRCGVPASAAGCAGRGHARSRPPRHVSHGVGVDATTTHDHPHKARWLRTSSAGRLELLQIGGDGCSKPLAHLEHVRAPALTLWERGPPPPRSTAPPPGGAVADSSCSSSSVASPASCSDPR
ncbi:unnamed protein product [Prorocentrum cordatum]|uniref:Uncharacterized protein n=1 Tax=Prorocentrum cordatum TaxID=2364126 RepID=A0ABN9Q385_9DINO|nr:unnamed protein product [Polarella glacialis]